MRPIIGDLLDNPDRIRREVKRLGINTVINTVSVAWVLQAWLKKGQVLYDDGLAARPLLEGLADSGLPAHFITTGAVTSYIAYTGCAFPEGWDDRQEKRIRKWERACPTPYKGRNASLYIHELADRYGIKVTSVAPPLVCKHERSLLYWDKLILFKLVKAWGPSRGIPTRSLA